MSEREGYPPGVPCWVETLQPDADAAASFYAELFGWELAGPGSMPGDGGRYYVARLRGRDVAGIGTSPRQGGPGAAAWMTHVRVASADAAAAQARQGGGAVLVEPFDAPPAGRLAVLADPDGASFCAWEPRARQGAQLVNEPGAWAMSQLRTHDPAAQAAFYGALLGWTTETFGTGEGAFTLFRLPGYVGGEPEQPVSREVVAVMSHANAGVPPHWSVDFWVDDVDAAAATATRQGGRVVSGPFATPVGRSALLADPRGAVFGVSKVDARAGRREAARS